MSLKNDWNNVNQFSLPSRFQQAPPANLFEQTPSSTQFQG